MFDVIRVIIDFGFTYDMILVVLSSNFSLLSSPEFISYDRDNCFAQCVAIVGSQFNFFLNCSKELPTPTCPLYDKSSSHHATRHLFHFCDNFNLVSFQFSQLKVWKHLFRCLDCRRLLLIFLKGTWPLVYHMTAKYSFKLMFFGLLLPWLRIWIYLINEPLSMKIYWLHLIP